ncbi:hypothetical protein EC968_001580 [Mortierella alpina]|nr:hypothetical protein EC968_001580 [Mortierella alpina]
MPHLTSLEQELAEEERVLRAEQEWFLTTQVKPGLENIQNALMDLTIKLPKHPVVKATIHSSIPHSAAVPAASTLFTTTATLSSNAGSSTVASSTSSVTGAPSTTDGVEAAVAESSSRGAETDRSSPDGLQEERQKPSQDVQQESGQLLQTAAIGNPQNAHQLLSTYRPPGHLTQPYFLEQIKDVQNHTAEALYKLQDYWRHIVRMGEQKNETRAKASSSSQHQDQDSETSSEIAESIGTLKTVLELMQRHLRAGIQAMAQPGKEKLYPFKVCDPKIFSPALSEDFVIEFYIRDSQLVCAAYALQLTGGSYMSSSGGGGGSNSSSGGAFVSYLQQALPGASTPTMASTSSMLTVAPSVKQSAEGFIPHSSPQQPPTVYGGSGSGSGVVGGAHLSASNVTTASVVGHGGGGNGAKSGQGTPSTLQHHHTSAAQPSHQRQLSSGGPIQQLPQTTGAKTPSSSFPWSPSRTVSVTDVHSNASVGPPSNESVVLPPSSKIGQTSKGGINKYRGKIATTLEDKVVQVQSPKLAEIKSVAGPSCVE